MMHGWLAVGTVARHATGPPGVVRRVHTACSVQQRTEARNTNMNWAARGTAKRTAAQLGVVGCSGGAGVMRYKECGEVVMVQAALLGRGVPCSCACNGSETGIYGEVPVCDAVSLSGEGERWRADECA